MLGRNPRLDKRRDNFFAVLDVDAEGVCKDPPGLKPAGHIRGGSQLVEYDDGYIAVVHEVFHPPYVDVGWNPLLGGFPPKAPGGQKSQVVYLHRFAVFDRDLMSVRLGRHFYFNRVGIEFCAGLTRWRGRLVVSYGVTDNEAWLIQVSKAAVDAELSVPQGRRP